MDFPCARESDMDGRVMDLLALLLTGLWLGSLTWHLATLCLAVCSPRKTGEPAPTELPAVSVIVPVVSPAPTLARCVASLGAMTYPHFEVLLCAASDDAAALAAVETEARALPGHVRAVSVAVPLPANTKVGLQSAGVAEARHGVLLFSDDNVLSPPQRLSAHVAKLQQGCSLVSAVVIATGAHGFWAAVDALFMHGFSRLQRAGARLGYAGVIGKSMMLRRQELEHAGGLPATASTLCEDAALRALMVGYGGRTELSVQPISQPLGTSDAAAVINRHRRWVFCRLRQVPVVFLAETLLCLPLGAAAAAALAPRLGLSGGLAAALTLAVAFAAEALFLRVLRWPVPPWFAPAWLTRELLFPLLALRALVPGRIRWRGRDLWLR
jgi:ceramide glucosyltransferase